MQTNVRAMADDQKPDTLPPHSDEAEQGIIGCILLAPTESMVECVEGFQGRDVFYNLQNQIVYDMLVEMWEEKTHIDAITTIQRVKDQGRLEEAVGRALIFAAFEAVVSPVNIPAYLRIVVEKFQLRCAVRSAGKIIASAYENDGRDVEKFIDEAQAEILSIDRFQTNVTLTAKELVLKTADAIQKCIRAVGVAEMPTGFSYWDRLAGGLHAGELVVIAGRPGTGKTSLIMNVAERMSIEGRKSVGVMSLEMSSQDLMLRLMCSRGRVNFHKLRTGFPTANDIEKLNLSGSKIGESGLVIDDTPRLSILQIRSKLRKMKQKYGIRVAFIDYLQLITSPPGLENNRVLALAEISAGLKASAKELGICIVVVSQLSRESEKRGGRPRMSDLRDSGAIEQDADFVGILFQKAMTEEDKQELHDKIRSDPHAETTVEVIMECCKNRNGPTGDVFFNFLRWCMRFEDLQRLSKPDAPDEPL